MTAPRRDHLRQSAEAALADGQTAAGDLGDGSVAADLHASTRHPSQGNTEGNPAGAAFGLGGHEDSVADAAFRIATPADAVRGAATLATAGLAGQAPSGAAGQSAAGQSAAGVSAGRGAGRNADWADIDWAHRRGRALTELIEHLDTERLTGKVAATVIVTMTIEQAIGAAQAALVQQSIRQSTGTLLEMTPSAGAASTDTGTLISASAARRIACQAGILPAVLGGPGQVLDLGRHHRFFSDPQRTALALIYDTCAADGCDRPFAWSELHHQQPWSKGGLTDLDHAIPLCGYHHRLIHDPHHRHHTTTVSPDNLDTPDNPGAKTVHFHEHAMSAPVRGGEDCPTRPHV
ncbi:MAG: HNH endonuclease [Actinomycetales bacterium]|nr:HNH endonuclease [Actinomycetales bacterium]